MTEKLVVVCGHECFRRSYKEHEEAFGSDGHSHHLDGGGGYVDVDRSKLSKLCSLNIGSLE